MAEKRDSTDPMIIVVSGAEGVGITTIMETLKARHSDRYVILSGDLCDFFAIPEVLSACRKKWIGICADISRQTNRAVVFYGDLTPDIFSGADEEYRKRLRYVSVVCDDDELVHRMEEKYGEKAHEKIRNIDMTYTQTALVRNHVYQGKISYPGIMPESIDTTGLDAEQSAGLVDRWIIRALTEN